MATVTKKKRKRKVVKGIEHGFSGYTNYGCRCEVCTGANRDHCNEYRDRRFAGNPLCIFPRCSKTASRAFTSGLCHRHGSQLVELRKTDPKKARRLERKLGLETPKMKVAA